jgi:EpsI family protein
MRFIPILLLLSGVALLLNARSKEVTPIHQDLESVPLNLAGWIGEDVPLGDDVLQVLGPGEFLNRVYRQPQTGVYISLFIAYFPSQQAGDTIHSPKNCLPGAGWAPIESGRLLLPAPEGAVGVNRYIVAKGLDRQLVLYWYQAHGRITASEYWAKIYLVADSIRMNRSDGALVRIDTPLGDGDAAQRAQGEAIHFSQELLPLLPRYIPR